MSIDYQKIYNDALKKLGCANILIAGKAGVGKSTLLNAIFGEDVATTGKGHHVTQTVKEYYRDGLLYHVFDTKGFAESSCQQMTDDLKREISLRKTNDAKTHIHIMWYCVSEEEGCIEKNEIDFIKEIARDIPVILVFTKAFDSNPTFYNKVVKEDYYSDIDYSVRVLAAPYSTPEGVVAVHGLDKLTNLTYELVPDAAKRAFAAAQRINSELIRNSITKIVAASASAAAATGAIPIPCSDAIILAPIQIGMIASISVTFGLNIEAGFLSTIISSAAGVTGATLLGRHIVSNLFKLVPGAGSVIGGTISAATAAALTTAMGWAYFNSLVMIRNKGSELSTKNITETFKLQLKQTKIK